MVKHDPTRPVYVQPNIGTRNPNPYKLTQDGLVVAYAYFIQFDKCRFDALNRPKATSPFLWFKGMPVADGPDTPCDWNEMV